MNLEPEPDASRPLFGAAQRLVKRAVRWYVVPPLQRLAERLHHLEARLAHLETRLLEPTQFRLSELETRLARLQGQLVGLRERPYVNPETPVPAARTDAAGGFDYVRFEERFRGPSARIKDLLREYVPLFRGRTVVVDLGCGRGEFLELLQESGVAGAGVEPDRGQLEECRRKGFPVAHTGALEYLESAADESIDGIFSAQLLEHLAWPAVTALFGLAHRKLRQGGIVVAETVNPHCLPALKVFHLDPTHVAPLYPETLRFLAESVGFRRVAIRYPERGGPGSDPYFDCDSYAVVGER